MKLSQNIKIALSAFSLLLVSLSTLLFFLKQNESLVGGHGQANVLHGGETTTEEEASTEEEDLGAYYREEANDTTEAIFVVDNNSKFVYLDEAFCKLLNVKCSKLQGKVFLEYVGDDDIADVASLNTKVLTNGKAYLGFGPYVINRGRTELLIMSDIYPHKELLIYTVKNITEKANELLNKTDTKAKVQEVEKVEDSDSFFEVVYPQVKTFEEDNLVSMNK